MDNGCEMQCPWVPHGTCTSCSSSDFCTSVRCEKRLGGDGDSRQQGRRFIPRSRTCTTIVFSWCSTWGNLGDKLTHKYPRDIVQFIGFCMGNLWGFLMGILKLPWS